MSGKIALLVEDLYNELEFWYPYYRFLEAGYEVEVIGTGRKQNYASKNGLVVQEGKAAHKAHSADYVAVIIPGGFAPDYMRRDPGLLALVRALDEQGKVVAAICHAGWVLVSAGVIKNRQVTCFHSIKDDLINAGGSYVDQEVVVDQNLVTARVPDDLPAFCRTILQKLA